MRAEYSIFTIHPSLILTSLCASQLLLPSLLRPYVYSIIIDESPGTNLFYRIPSSNILLVERVSFMVALCPSASGGPSITQMAPRSVAGFRTAVKRPASGLQAISPLPSNCHVQLVVSIRREETRLWPRISFTRSPLR